MLTAPPRPLRSTTTRLPVALAAPIAVLVVALLALLVAPANSDAAIVSGPLVRVGGNEVTVTWRTDLPGSSDVAWDIAERQTFAGHAWRETGAGPAVYQHGRTFTVMREGTYHLRVRTRTVAGSVWTSRDVTFTIGATGADPAGRVEVLDGHIATIDGNQGERVVTTADLDRVYAGGAFTRVAQRQASTAMLDGTSGEVLDRLPSTNGTVYAVVPDGTGGFLIGGTFTQVAGLPRGRIARIGADGGLDPTFGTLGSGFNATVNAIAVSGSQVFVGGSFTTHDGVARVGAARLSLSTGVAEAWNTGVGVTGGSVTAIAIDGTNVFLGGSFTAVGGTARARAARLDASTGTLAAWNTGTGITGGTVNAMLVSGTSLYLGGSFTTFNGAGRSRLLKLDVATGAEVGGFSIGTGFTGGTAVQDLAASGGMLYVVGDFTTYAGTAKNNAAKLAEASGSLQAWNTAAGPDGIVHTVHVDGSGVLVGGAFTTWDGTSRARLLRVSTAAGSAAPGWSAIAGCTTGAVRDAIVLGSSILVGGDFSSCNTYVRNRLVAWDRVTGTIDPEFGAGAGANGTVEVLAVNDEDAAIYVGGAFTSVDGVAVNRVAKLSYLGVPNATWTSGIGTGANGTVYALDVSGDWVWLGGDFTNVDGVALARAARVSRTSGSADPTWGSGTGFNGRVEVIEAGYEGSVFTGGAFTAYQGTTRNRIAKFEPNGTIDTAFDPVAGLDGTVYALATIDVTGIYVGGAFANAGGVARGRIARLNFTTGALDTGFAPATGFDNSVYSLQYGVGRVYAGGAFLNYDGATAQKLARLRTDGTLDAAWGQAGGGANGGNVVEVYVDAPDVVLGGSFTSMHAVPRLRLHVEPTGSDTPVTITSAPTASQVWTQATISWATNEVGTSEVAWGDESRAAWSSYDSRFTRRAYFEDRHSVTLDHLVPGTYYYRVRTAAAGGFVVTSPEYQFTVAPPTDADSIVRSNVNGSIHDIDVQDGVAYAVGAFTRAHSRSGHGGLFDLRGRGAALPRTPYVNGSVMEATPGDVNGFFIVGDFDRVGGHVTHNVAKIRGDGGVDTSFSAPAMDASVITVHFNDTTDHLYIGGYFTTVGGVTRQRFARLDHATGALDTSFTANADGGVNAITSLGDGSMVFAGGTFTNFDGAVRNRAGATNAAGTLQSWHPDLNGTVHSMMASGTNVYVGGSFTTAKAGTITRRRALRINSTSAGTVDTFDPDMNGTVTAVYVASGWVYLGGQFTTIGGTARNTLGRVSGTGAVDATWNPNPNGTTIAEIHTYNDLVYVGGTFDSIGGQARRNVAGVLDSGTGLAQAFNPLPTASVNALAIRSGRVFVGGDYVTGFGGTTRMGAAAFRLSDGALLPWNPAPTLNGGYANAVDATTDDVYLGGSFTDVKGAARNGLAAVDPELGSVRSWNPNPNVGATINDILVRGTTAYVSGVFTTMSGSARVNATGVSTATGAPTAFNLNSNADALALATDGTSLFVAGDFTTVNGGTARQRVAKYSLAGVLDATWTPGTVDAVVRDVDVLGGTVYAVGDFTTFESTARSGAGATTASGAGSVTAWNPSLSSATGTMLAAGIDARGTTAVIGGRFSTAGGQSRANLVEVNLTSGAATSWAPDPSDIVQEVLVAGGATLIGGSFNNVNHASADHFAQFDRGGTGPVITTAPTVATTPYQSTITWKTDVGSTTEVAYGTSPASTYAAYASKAANTSPASTANWTSHSLTLSLLEPTTYYYRVRSATDTGEVVTSAEQSFTVAPPPSSAPVPSPTTDGVVRASVSDAQGRTYLGGHFTQVGTMRGNGIRLDPSGAPLAASPWINGPVLHTTGDGAGGWIIVGRFTRVGAFARQHVARLLPDGGVDPDFDPGVGPNGVVRAAEVLGANVYVGGDFTTWNGSATGAGRLAKLNLATGAIDTAFTDGAGFNATVHDVASNGTAIYVGGEFTTYTGSTTAAGRLAKLDPATGAIDTAFTNGAGFNGEVRAVAFGVTELYVGGLFTSYAGSGSGSIRLARLDPTTGDVDTTFTDGSGFNNSVNDVLAHDGSVYVTGEFTGYNLSSTAAGKLAKLNSLGTIDTTFTDGTGLAHAKVLTNDSFNELGANAAHGDALAVQGSRLLVGGSFTDYAGGTTGTAGIMAVDLTTGAIDTSFTDGTGFGIDTVRAISVQANTVFVGGSFSTYAGTARGNLARLTGTGVLDGTWNPGVGTDEGVDALAVTDTAVYVGGRFTAYQGSTANAGRLMALDPASSSAARLAGFSVAGTGFNQPVETLEIANGYVYAGGSFTAFNAGTTGVGHLARLDSATGAVDTAFTDGTGFNGNLYDIEVVGTDLYATGSFTAFNGSTTGAGRLAKVHATSGSIDTAFTDGTGLDGTGLDLDVVDGSLYVAGSFATYATNARSSVAKVDRASGAVDATFVPPSIGGGAASFVDGLDDGLLVAGDFTTVGGSNRAGSAYLHPATGALGATPGTPSSSTYSGFSIGVEGSSWDPLNGVLTIGSGSMSTTTSGRGRGFDGVPVGGYARFEPCSRGACDDPDTLTITVDQAALAATTLGEVDVFASFTTTVTSNANAGWTLAATDASDSGGAACSTGTCAGTWIPDWTGTPAAPTTWSTQNGHVGLTVRDATGGRDTRWGPGTGTAEGDVAANRYAGLRSGTPTQLHRTGSFTGSDPDATTILATWRTRVPSSQTAGSYVSTVTLTATANP